VAESGDGREVDAGARIASRLEQELSDEAIWELVSSPPSEARSTALAARAVELYRDTVPYFQPSSDELTPHDTLVLGFLRGVADALALASFDGWTEEERREWVLPTRALIVHLAAVLGVHSATEPTEPIDPRGSEPLVPPDDVLDFFARDFGNTLDYFDFFDANRGTQSDREYLGTMRDLAIRLLANARRWGIWARRVEGEPALMEYAGMAIVISQMMVVAGFDTSGAEDLFPDRAWLTTQIENSRALPWLTSRGAKIPDWLSQT
jgi:hypothetical protein